MPRSGWLFTVVTIIGIVGACTLIGANLSYETAVAAQPLVGAGMLGLPVNGMLLTSVSPPVVVDEPIISPPVPVLKSNAVSPLTLTADSAIVIDGATETVLFEKEADRQRSIASITKLLTAIIATDIVSDWSVTTTVHKQKGIDGPHILEDGDTITLHDLLFTSLIGSSNTATLSLVDAIMPKGASFAARMRLAAEKYGLASVEPYDAAGLSANNRATVRDAVKLLQLAMERQIIRDALGARQYEARTSQGAKREVVNTNWVLLGKIPLVVSKMIAGKTGFLPEAGFNFVTAVEDENGHILYVAVLGAKDHYARFTEAQAIAQWAYEQFEWRQ